MMYHVDNVA